MRPLPLAESRCRCHQGHLMTDISTTKLLTGYCTEKPFCQRNSSNTSGRSRHTTNLQIQNRQKCGCCCLQHYSSFKTHLLLSTISFDSSGEDPDKKTNTNKATSQKSNTATNHGINNMNTDNSRSRSDASPP